MDRYERERFVGRGACGSAFVCRRISDSKPVVIKEIAIEMNDSDREDTLNEIKATVYIKKFFSQNFTIAMHRHVLSQIKHYVCLNS
jgi:serine/threonine protein kinase